MILFFAAMGVVIGLPALLTHWLAIDWLIQQEVVSDSRSYWDAIASTCLIVTLPPLFIFGFRAAPDNVQNGVKEGVVIFGMASHEILEWIGKGVLIALGVTLFLWLNQ